MFLTDRASSVILSTNIDTNTMAPEGTDVIFTCTVDSNPVPQLSLYIRQSTGEEIPTGQAFTDSSATFLITLNRNHNGQAFFCKATNTELQYTIHSDPVELSVQCRLINCMFYSSAEITCTHTFFLYEI